MAIYHLSVKPLAAVPAVAPRPRPRRTGRRSGSNRTTGEVFDYTRKRGVEHTEMVLSSAAAKQDIHWARDRTALWNAAEVAERRSDARVAREYEVALPHELNRAPAPRAGADVFERDRQPLRRRRRLCDPPPTPRRR